MYTSDTKITKTYLIRAVVYISVSIFCALFSFIYEHFSHGVYSYYMIYAFAAPLVLGALPSVILALMGKRRPCRATHDFWASAIAFLTVGCIVKGVLEIYGTSHNLCYLFFVSSAVLFVLAICTNAIYLNDLKRNR